MNQTAWSSPTNTNQAQPFIPMQSPMQQKRSANLWQLTYNELFKLWKRPLVWGLLALDLFFVFAAWLVLIYYAISSPDGFHSGHLLGGVDKLIYAIGQPMTLGRRGGEFLAAHLAV